MNEIQCPLCTAPMHDVVKQMYKSTPTKNIPQYRTYWTCEDCPAILMEYIHKGDAHNVANAIELNNKQEDGTQENA